MKLFYKRNSHKLSDESIKKVLIPSVVGIMMCMVCFVGTTLAWFTDNISISTQDIKSANYSLAIVITDIESKVEVIPDGGGKRDLITNSSYFLENKEYKISAIANGSAKTGYLKIEGPSGVSSLYSIQLAPEEKIDFTFIPEVAGEYSFNSVWGTYTGDYIINNDDVVGTLVEEKVEDIKEEIIKDEEISDDVEVSDNVESGDDMKNPSNKLDGSEVPNEDKVLYENIIESTDL